MNNMEIRQIIRDNRIRQYEVAEVMGVSEYTFCVWLRRELPPEKKVRVMEAINKMVKGGGENA